MAEQDDGNNHPRSLRVSPVRLAMVLAVSLAVIIGGLCGWLGYGAYQSHQDQELRALMVQVGRQGAINLTTIDYQQADADVQRILDSSTGGFYEDFKARSEPFIDVVKKVQSKSVGAVTEAGVESVTGREGQVLVAVTVNTTTKGIPDPRPRYWRMRLTVSEVDGGGEFKVSRVDFVA